MKAIQKQHQDIIAMRGALNTWSNSACGLFEVSFPYNKQEDTVIGRICEDVISI